MCRSQKVKFIYAKITVFAVRFGNISWWIIFQTFAICTLWDEHDLMTGFWNQRVKDQDRSMIEYVQMG